MTVTENASGTTLDDKGQAKATPETKGETPSVASKVSSEQPKTYTKESEETAVKDAVHQALSAAGRVSTDTAEAERILNAAKQTQADTEAEQKRQQDERDAADREAVKADPEALKSLETQIRQRDEKAKLASGKAELATEKATHDAKVASDLEQIRVFNRTQQAAEVSAATGVSLDIILKHAKDDSREAMEAVANDFKGAKPPLPTDDGRTIGGAEKTEEEKLKARYPTM